MTIRFGVALTLAIALGAPAVAGPAAQPDGFAAFWPSFAAAAAKDDAKGLGSMTVLGPKLGDDGGSFAKFHAAALGPAKRRCLAKTKPMRNVDPEGNLSYGAFCGEIIYIFSKTTGGWKLTELGVND